MVNYTPIFNLKAVIRETGLSPATLRAWERRYLLVKPHRSAGGHRLYSEYDIEMLKWLVSRQQEGLSISRAVEMWREMEKNGQDPLQQTHAQLATDGVSGGMMEGLREAWIAACMDFNEETAEREIAHALAIATPEIVCTQVLQKGLAEMGARWSRGEISVQQEHFASALAMRRLNSLFATAAAPTRPGSLLAACPPGEEHDFSLLLATFLLRRRGWNVVYLGTNVPLAQLDLTIANTSPLLVISVAHTLGGAASLREMNDCVNAQGVPLAYGGGVFNLIPALTGRIPGYFLGNDIAGIPQVIEGLLSQHPPLPGAHPVSHEYVELLAAFLEKEAFIISSVTEVMHSSSVTTLHLKELNETFTRHIVSALSLGDIHLLDTPLDGLESLLESQGLAPSQLAVYYAAYRRGVEEHLGGEADLLSGWLANRGKRME